MDITQRKEDKALRLRQPAAAPSKLQAADTTPKGLVYDGAVRQHGSAGSFHPRDNLQTPNPASPGLTAGAFCVLLFWLGLPVTDAADEGCQ